MLKRSKYDTCTVSIYQCSCLNQTHSAIPYNISTSHDVAYSRRICYRRVTIVSRTATIHRNIYVHLQRNLLYFIFRVLYTWVGAFYREMGNRSRDRMRVLTMAHLDVTVHMDIGTHTYTYS